MTLGFVPQKYSDGEFLSAYIVGCKRNAAWERKISGIFQEIIENIP
jgi:hypothetical protein